MLTKEQINFFKQNGYLKIENLISKAQCEQTVEAIWTFMGKSPSEPDGWYSPPEGMDNYWGSQSAGMVELYHHQRKRNNRQTPELYEAFSSLLNKEDLWVSLDRVNMKPPMREEHPELSRAFIHWDTDTSILPHPIPCPYRLQGVLYLTDTDENQGGFQCVPSIFGDLENYLKQQPHDRNPKIPDITGHDIEIITGNAGDFVIWDVLLPHGNGINKTNRPRFAQYITMYPAQFDNVDLRQKRIDSWMHNKAMENWPGDPRNWEATHPTASLTPLGRKLLGIDAWL